MTTRVLITGIAGFIGSHVVDKLSRRKFDIFGIDDMSSGNLENLRHNESKVEEILTENIINPAAVFAAFEKYKPEVVIHLAAQPSLLASMKSPEYDAGVNIIGTINILRACEVYKVNKLIFSSTSAITSNSVVMDSAAQGMLMPNNPYGLSKRVAEDYIRLLRHKMDRQSIILRFANVYGPRQVPLGENQLIPRIIRHFLYGDHFEIYGTGTQSRDFIYAGDVADLIYTLCIKEKKFATETLNVATGKNHTVLEIYDAVATELGVTEPPIHGESRDEREHVKMLVRDNWWNWKAKTSLKDGIKKTVAWWKEQDG